MCTRAASARAEIFHFLPFLNLFFITKAGHYKPRKLKKMGTIAF